MKCSSFLVLVLLANVICKCDSLVNKRFLIRRSASCDISIQKLETGLLLPVESISASSVASIRKSSILRSRVSTMCMSNRMTLDKSDGNEMEEEVTHLDEAELRAFWVRSGMSASSYDEDIALSKMMMAENDDYDDDDDDEAVQSQNNEDADEELNKVVIVPIIRNSSAEKRRKMLSSSVAINNVKAISNKGGLLSRKLLNRPLKKDVTENDSRKNRQNADSDIITMEGRNIKKVEKNIPEKIPSPPQQDVIVNDIPAGRSVGKYKKSAQ